MNPVTNLRLAVMTQSGFENEAQMSEELINTISWVGQNIIDRKAADLSRQQHMGIQRAVHDTPIALQEFFRLIAFVPMDEEDRANLRFILLKLVDDALSLGTIAGQDIQQDQDFSVLQRERARRPRKKSGARGSLEELIFEHHTPGSTAKQVWQRMVRAIRQDKALPKYGVSDDGSEIVVDLGTDESEGSETSYSEKSFHTIYSAFKAKIER